MRLQLIRNATMRLDNGGRALLTDPFLAEKYTIESFAGISANPLVDLPCSPEEVLSGVEMTLISHLHVDHFDPVAQDKLSKEAPIFCQPLDRDKILDMGFVDVRPVEESVSWRGIEITRTAGQHGIGAIGKRMGPVSGFVLQAVDEPVVYWAGDTILNSAVRETIERFLPDIIIVHASGAKFGDSGPIVMDAEQTLSVCRLAPDALIVAIHLDTLDHGTVRRDDLKFMAEDAGLTERQLLILPDGEILTK